MSQNDEFLAKNPRMESKQIFSAVLNICVRHAFVYNNCVKIESLFFARCFFTVAFKSFRFADQECN